MIATCALVATPDGGFFYYEDFLSYGGLVVTPGTYLAFMGKFWGDGSARSPGQIENWTWLGSINGTFTIARRRPDGTMLVAFFDQRADASGLDYDNFWQTLDVTTDAITKWP